MVAVTADRTGDDSSGAAAGSVTDRLAELRRRIESTGRALDSVTIVGVTKGFSANEAAQAADAGIVDLGENYADELLTKRAELARDRIDGARLRWHFLGAIQRNKVARLADVVDLWHGVDRLAAGEAIASRRPGASVLVQIDVEGDGRRNGVSEGDASDLVAGLRRLDLDVAGLMVVASPALAAAGTPVIEQFTRVATLGRELGLRELSMGMTGDVELALEAGATIIRVGRGLFGARPAAAGVRA